MSEMTSALSKRAETIGFYAICLMAISMPISRAGFNIGALILLICWIASGRYRGFLKDISQSNTLLACTLLFAWIAISALYSSAPADIAWTQAGRYHKLLLIPIITSFLTSSCRTRRYLATISVGLLLLMIAYLTDLYIGIPGSHSIKTNTIGVFNNYIVEGLSLSIFALILLTYSVDLWHSRRKISLTALFLCGTSIAIVFFINPGRGAQLSLISGLLALSYLIMPIRARTYGMAAITLFITFTALQSDLLVSRFETAISELKVASPDKSSSIGSRINAWQNGLTLWKEMPIIGHGSGSYKHIMFTQKGDVVGGCADNPVCLQPHNQYVLFMVEQGLVGCVLFIVLTYTLIAPIKRSKNITAKLSAAFALTFAVHSLFDSGLVMGNHMVIFVTLCSAMIAFEKANTSEQQPTPEAKNVHTMI